MSEHWIFGYCILSSSKKNVDEICEKRCYSYDNNMISATICHFCFTKYVEKNMSRILLAINNDKNRYAMYFLGYYYHIMYSVGYSNESHKDLAIKYFLMSLSHNNLEPLESLYKYNVSLVKLYLTLKPELRHHILSYKIKNISSVICKSTMCSVCYLEKECFIDHDIYYCNECCSLYY